MQERFFESLGLPPDLSEHAMRRFLPVMQHNASGTSGFRTAQGGHVSDSSFLTAFDAQKAESAHFPSRPSDPREEMFVDSQRKLSAPVSHNHRIEAVRHDPLKNEPIKNDKRDQRREIMTISVDIGNAQGETADILIREGDEPGALAAAFAARHGIQSRELVELLAEQIQLNLEAVLKEEEESRAARHPSPPDMLVGGSLDNRKASLLKDTLSRPYVEPPTRPLHQQQY